MANDWSETALGDVCDLLTGFPFKSAKYTDLSSGIRLVRGDNVVQGRLRWDGVKKWPADATDGLQQYFLQEDDVVLAMDRPWIEAGLKYAAISENDLPALLVQRVSRLRGGSLLDTRFLKYLIGSEQFTNHVLAVQTGTAVPHISAGQIKSYTFRLPPLRTQRRIADMLGMLDGKIELNRRMNDTLESMARRLFKTGSSTSTPSTPKPLSAANTPNSATPTSPAAPVQTWRPKSPNSFLTASRIRHSGRSQRSGWLGRLATSRHSTRHRLTRVNSQQNSSTITAFLHTTTAEHLSGKLGTRSRATSSRSQVDVCS